MDIYTLTPSFQKAQAVDTYQSLVWTERYNEAGDVALVWASGSALDSLIVEGTLLYTSDSLDVMRIETVSTEKGVTTATGRSLTAFLENRIFRNTWATTSDSWSLTGVPGTLAVYVVQQMCRPGGIMAGTGVIPGGGVNEVIPNLNNGAAASGTSVTIAVQYGNVYDAVKTICDLDALGFRLYPPNIFDGTGTLIFTTYRGLDRTTAQSVNNVVVFESAMDTLSDVTELRSIAGYKNVAYAWANAMTAQSSIGVAYAPGAQFLTGFDRRTLMVDASDVNSGDYTAANLQLVLNQKAKDALANNNYVRMTDGTVVPQDDFVYGTNYGLGDIIELRGSNNVKQNARIMEFIRSKDSNGELAYPTLSVIS